MGTMVASHLKQHRRRLALPPLLALVLALGGCAGQRQSHHDVIRLHGASLR